MYIIENSLSQFKGGLIYKELECKVKQIRNDFHDRNNRLFKDI